MEFQRNVGLAVDGIAGPLTVDNLRRLLGRTTGRRPVVQVRELDRLRRSRPDLADQRIAIGEFGGTAALATALTRILRARGANVLKVDQPDERDELRLVVPRHTAEQHVGEPLDEGEARRDHPEGEPMAIVGAAGRFDRDDRREGGEDEDEDVSYQLRGAATALEEP